ncbi:hypothetical protein AAG570_009033 [Ranatra chinensis]|uniref:Uncharacterized protein n=1 Tax=Ranatra chinensis TaxID=642074 RepID=A0ABD0Z397_9HEMI
MTKIPRRLLVTLSEGSGSGSAAHAAGWRAPVCPLALFVCSPPGDGHTAGEREGRGGGGLERIRSEFFSESPYDRRFTFHTRNDYDKRFPVGTGNTRRRTAELVYGRAGGPRKAAQRVGGGGLGGLGGGRDSEPRPGIGRLAHGVLPGPGQHWESDRKSGIVAAWGCSQCLGAHTSSRTGAGGLRHTRPGGYSTFRDYRTNLTAIDTRHVR